MDFKETYDHIAINVEIIQIITPFKPLCSWCFQCGFITASEPLNYEKGYGFQIDV